MGGRRNMAGAYYKYMTRALLDRRQRFRVLLDGSALNDGVARGMDLGEFFGQLDEDACNCGLPRESAGMFWSAVDAECPRGQSNRMIAFM
jgi:hypothetical protein